MPPNAGAAVPTYIVVPVGIDWTLLINDGEDGSESKSPISADDIPAIDDCAVSQGPPEADAAVLPTRTSC